MNKFRKLLLAGVALTAFLLSGCSGEDAGKATEAVPASPAASEAVQASQISFEGTDLEGNAVSSEIFAQSKLTMVNVWATYCNPCLREMPELGELAGEYAPEEFQLIGIISDVLEGEDQSLAESLVQQTGANYPHLLVNESIYYTFLTDVSGVPTTFFLDEDGRALGYVVGAQEKSAWKEIINGLLEDL